jgi:hypothetical protein
MHKHATLLGFTDYSTLGWEQGFINTWGEFLTRKEAWVVANHNNQVICLVGSQHMYNQLDAELYSENLY